MGLVRTLCLPPFLPLLSFSFSPSFSSSLVGRCGKAQVGNCEWRRSLGSFESFCRCCGYCDLYLHFKLQINSLSPLYWRLTDWSGYKRVSKISSLHICDDRRHGGSFIRLDLWCHHHIYQCSDKQWDQLRVTKGSVGAGWGRAAQQMDVNSSFLIFKWVSTEVYLLAERTHCHSGFLFHL